MSIGSQLRKHKTKPLTRQLITEPTAGGTADDEKFIWMPISGWYGSNGKVYNIDVDDEDVEAVIRLISNSRNKNKDTRKWDESYWHAVFYMALYKLQN